jgi:hypothetical protein
MPTLQLTFVAAGALLLSGMSAVPSHAIVITPTNDAATLRAALGAGGGITINSLLVTGGACPGSGNCQTGTFTNASGTYGTGPGIVISSGKVSDYGDGPNSVGNQSTQYNVAANPAQDSLLDLVGGMGNYWDPVQIDVIFSADAATSTVFFSVVFGSEEFSEYVGSAFIDGFGLFLNGSNIAFVGGQPVNVNHPAFAALAGTQLDGVIAPGGNPFLTFSGGVTPGSTNNTLTFILADKSDSILDSTAYIASLGGTPPEPAPVPEPSTLLLLGAGLAGALARKRTRQASEASRLSPL